MASRIVLVDDHRLFREGLRKILEEDPSLEVVAEASNGEDGLERIDEHKPDVTLIDLNMGSMSGVELMQAARRRECGTRFIVISQYDTQGYVTQALRGGASAYVVKSAGASDVRAAVEAVLEGRSFVSPSVAHLLVEAMNPSSGRASGASGLTAREREVLSLIAEGLSSKEIAAELGLSPKTVETHRANLMAKLDVHKTSKLVRVAIQEGLVGT
ncbi:MAG: response regulator transcription factor [Myxococcota bacterium]|nr:response regulator transcription factor [Myxococcota bacterium]